MSFWKRLFGGKDDTHAETTSAKPPRKLGAPSSGLRQFKTKVAERGDSIELSGQWLDEIFPGQPSVKVMKHGDVKGFLARTEDKFKWTVAYMHHPDPEMLAQALEAAAPLSQLATTEDLAYLVTHGDTRIEEAAIKPFWSALGEGSFQMFFNVLGSGGMMPSGIDHERAKWAVQRIYTECPTDCPESKKRKFEQLAKERFGPSALQSGPSERMSDNKSRAKFKENTHKDTLGHRTTYEIYTAGSKEDALAFLESKSVTKDLYFVVVETPEGNWCKDKDGFYQE